MLNISIDSYLCNALLPVKNYNKKKADPLHLRKTGILVFVFFMFSSFLMNAQSPTVEWQHYYFPGYQKNNNLLISLPPGFDPTHEEYSSEDWIYDVKAVYDGVKQTGYICAGYTSFMNNGDITGCSPTPTGPASPDCERFEFEDATNNYGCFVGIIMQKCCL